MEQKNPFNIFYRRQARVYPAHPKRTHQTQRRMCLLPLTQHSCDQRPMRQIADWTGHADRQSMTDMHSFVMKSHGFYHSRYYKYFSCLLFSDKLKCRFKVSKTLMQMKWKIIYLSMNIIKLVAMILNMIFIFVQCCPPVFSQQYHIDRVN